MVDENPRSAQTVIPPNPVRHKLTGRVDARSWLGKQVLRVQVRIETSRAFEGIEHPPPAGLSASEREQWSADECHRACDAWKIVGTFWRDAKSGDVEQLFPVDGKALA